MGSQVAMINSWIFNLVPLGKVCSSSCFRTDVPIYLQLSTWLQMYQDTYNWVHCTLITDVPIYLQLSTHALASAVHCKRREYVLKKYCSLPPLLSSFYFSPLSIEGTFIGKDVLRNINLYVIFLFIIKTWFHLKRCLYIWDRLDWYIHVYTCIYKGRKIERW